MDGQNRAKFDWRTLAGLVLTVLCSTAVQWGIYSNQVSELNRRVEKIENLLENRTLDRTEYEKRHEELADRVRELESREEANRKELMELMKRR
jgi:chromosome segregation ATPase